MSDQFIPEVETLARELWEAYATSMQHALPIQASAWEELDEAIRAAWVHVARVAMTIPRDR